MKPGAFRIIRDLDLGIIEPAQLFYRLQIGGAHVRGRDDPKLPVVLSESLQLVENHPQPAPFDKGDQKIDPVAGQDLFLELGDQRRLPDRAGKERGPGD